MAKAARGSLSSLSARLAPKSPPAAAAAPEPAPAGNASTPGASLEAGQDRDFKTMMCRVNRAGWREMTILSADLDRNLEDMLIEAANDFLRKHGRPPVVEKRSPPARKPTS